MNWWRGDSKNELGVSLPDEAAQLETETEPLQARNQRDADRKCEEIAEEYGGTDPRAVPTGKQSFDCRFKVWR